VAGSWGGQRPSLADYVTVIEALRHGDQGQGPGDRRQMALMSTIPIPLAALSDDPHCLCLELLRERPPLALGHDTIPIALSCDLGCLPNWGRFI
jgi:hypothetical protein